MVIQFYIQGTKNPTPIYIRFRDGRTFDVRIKTGLVINPNNWTAKKWMPGKAKTSFRDALSKRECTTIAGLLSSIEKNLTEKYNATSNKLLINSQWLENFLNPKKEISSIPSGLVDYFTYYEKVKGNELKNFSKVKLNVVKHFIERMETDTKSKFEVSDIDENFKNKFVEYSLSEGYAQNTIARNFTFIKTICYHAEYNGISISPKLKKLTLKKQKVDKIYLTPDELIKIKNVKLDADHLDTARDWLLISCETGQRVSDFLRFTKDMIRQEAGKNLIEFTQVKTEKIMTIPLSKLVLEILKKRKGNFPLKMVDQKYNKYIKTVCEKAKLTYKVKGSIIDKKTLRKVSGVFEKHLLVTSHIGRRSFASNNYGKIPTSLLIGATGHSTEKMFLEYIGKSDTQKALQLAEYF